MAKSNFEDRLKRLEELSDSIKNSEIPLEEALSLFEEGISLARTLEKDLGEVEGKVEILINNPDITTETKADTKTAPAKSRKKHTTDNTPAADKETPQFDLFSLDN